MGTRQRWDRADAALLLLADQTSKQTPRVDVRLGDDAEVSVVAIDARPSVPMQAGIWGGTGTDPGFPYRGERQRECTTSAARLVDSVGGVTALLTGANRDGLLRFRRPKKARRQRLPGEV